MEPESPKLFELPASEIKFWSIAFGALTSGATLFSVVQRVFQIGLTPTMAAFLKYYRHLTHAPLNFLESTFHFVLPLWYKDAIVLSGICTVIVIRSFSVMIREPRLKDRIVLAFVGLLLWIGLWSPVILALFLALHRWSQYLQRKQLDERLKTITNQLGPQAGEALFATLQSLSREPGLGDDSARKRERQALRKQFRALPSHVFDGSSWETIAEQELIYRSIRTGTLAAALVLLSLFALNAKF